MPYKETPKKRKKRRAAFPLVLALIIVLAGTGGYFSIKLYERQQDTAFVAAMNVSLSSAEQRVRSAEAGRSDFLDTTFTSLRDARLAEEARVAEQKRLAEEKRKAEEARIAEEKRVAEEKRKAEEAARKAEETRKKAAEEAAKQAEVIAAEKAKAEAEAAERKRISVQIKAQADNAEYENNAYLSMQPAPIVNLGVQAVFQKPELPNGCEITALATVLNWMGVWADKTDLADNYLPQFPFYMIGDEKTGQRAGGDPDLFFAGNPRNTKNAYYCFAGPIVSAANSYLGNAGHWARAYNITGSDESDLISQLDRGNPVILWGTLSMGDAFTFAPNAWVIDEATGAKHIPYLNLHSVVVYGYDDSFFYVADPLRGNVAYFRSTLMNAFGQMGSRAIVIS